MRRREHDYHITRLDAPVGPTVARGLCSYVQSAIARLFGGRQGLLTANYGRDDGRRLPSHRRRSQSSHGRWRRRRDEGKGASRVGNAMGVDR